MHSRETILLIAILLALTVSLASAVRAFVLALSFAVVSVQ